MRKWMAVCLIAASGFAFSRVAPAQDAPKPAETAKAEPHYYHLKFVLEELDGQGKVTNSRTYTSAISTQKDESASIRSGSKIPIATGSYSAGTSNALVNTQFQYIDIGVNIDARKAREVDHKLCMEIKAEITSQGTPVDIQTVREPVIRQNKWQAVVVIPLDKPTTVFTSDSLDSTGSMRMLVTATPIP